MYYTKQAGLNRWLEYVVGRRQQRERMALAQRHCLRASLHRLVHGIEQETEQTYEPHRQTYAVRLSLLVMIAWKRY
jgi:hypothetical protein